MVEKAATIWADGPSSSPDQPAKPLIREWGTWLESFISAIGTNSGTIFATKAEIDADLAHAANSMAWVMGDAVTAYNGIYRKLGDIGAGSWVRVSDLPFSFIIASDAGNGSPDAILATTSIPVAPSALIWANIFDSNTGSPVTISFNGGPALTIKTNTGNDISPGGLVSGMVIMGVIAGSDFRLINDQVSSAIVAAAEAALLAAELAANQYDQIRDLAEAALPRKDGEIQDLWTVGNPNQIISSIKGDSFINSFEQSGTGSDYETSDEPVSRMQSFSEVNVYDASATDGYKGLTQPVSTIGAAEQYVIGPKAFDKIAGRFIELHDKAPNGGEHFGLAVHVYQHANRKDPDDTNPDTGGFFPINNVADTWGAWWLGADMGHHANLFLHEMNIRNEWGMRPETLTPNTSYIPDSGLGFQIVTQYYPDFSQYHITRAFSIVPSNSWGAANGNPDVYVGFETGGFISGYAKFGLIFGKSIHYENPHDPDGSSTNPTAILFANDDATIMSFLSEGLPAFEFVRLDANTLGYVRNSDGMHFIAMNKYTGETFIGNGNTKFDMNGTAFFGGGVNHINTRKVTPTDAGSVDLSPTDYHLIIDPVSALASLSVSLPDNPSQGRTVKISFTQSVAALSILPGAGGAGIANAYNSANAGQVVSYEFYGAAWYRS